MKVALKFARDWCGGSDVYHSSVVMHEARLLWQARGAHVVPLLQVFRRRDAPPVLMCPAADTDLADFLAKRGALQERTSRDLSSQLTCGVRHLHSKFIMHRDLKPANVLLRFEDTCPMWRLMIADFGSSREVSPAARASNILQSMTQGGLQRMAFPLTPRTGTITHRAPEVFRPDAEYGCPADVWSCGSMIYQFITGYPPSLNHREEDVLTDLVDVLGPCSPSDAVKWRLPAAVTAIVGRSTNTQADSICTHICTYMHTYIHAHTYVRI